MERHRKDWLSGVLDRDMLDASSLVLPEIGIVRSDDPRFRHARRRGQRLLRNGFMMRYADADDFGEPSNAFLLCTFWYIDALASVGRRDEALELFNNLLALRNHVGLLRRISIHTPANCGATFRRPTRRSV